LFSKENNTIEVYLTEKFSFCKTKQFQNKRSKHYAENLLAQALFSTKPCFHFVFIEAKNSLKIVACDRGA
jgi:hypothetical protein